MTSQSCEQLPSICSTSKSTSHAKALHSLPERLTDSEKMSRRCRSCEGILDADETHERIPLPTPLDAATQTKRKKNFMDRCVNKVRLC
ncbi:hypothetical protein RR48_14621 [Papilio machaon]|uniref:Uncharacterized protein n=1 Tax=Papilio machaon TaxID=76193 RepID=A0A194QLC6_PAPMA|nr:hypothetical protein RR48_14621 [Papilio machaon]